MIEQRIGKSHVYTVLRYTVWATSHKHQTSNNEKRIDVNCGRQANDATTCMNNCTFIGFVRFNIAGYIHR